MKKLFFPFLALMLCSIIDTNAQIFRPYDPRTTSPFEVLALDNAILGYNINRISGRFHYFVSDAKLNKTFEKIISLPPNISRTLLHQKGDHVFILFNYDSRSEYLKMFLSLNTISGEVDYFPIQSITAFADDFRVLEDKLVILAHFEEKESYLQFLNINPNPDHQQPLTAHLYKKVLSIEESEGYLDILALNQSKPGSQQLELMTYNQEGEMMYLIETEYPSRKKPYIKTAQFIENENGKFRIAGTFSKKSNSNFSGYFYWDLDQTLEQNFREFPAASLEGFGKHKKGKLKKQLKQELNKGFRIVKMDEIDGKLTLVATPNNDIKHQNRYEKVFKQSVFHYLHLDREGRLLSDDLIAFDRSLSSPFVNNSFLNNPPIYTIDGDLYFVHNEEFTNSPNLIIRQIMANSIQPATHLLPETLREGVLFFRTRQWKEKEILVYGLKGDLKSPSSPQTFFLEKMVIE